MFHSLNYLMNCRELGPQERILAAKDYLNAQPEVSDIWLTLSTAPDNRIDLGNVHVCVAWCDDKERRWCVEGPECRVMFAAPAGGV